LSEYAIFLRGASSVVGAVNETKFGTKVAYGVRMMPESRIRAWSAHSAEKARDTTLDDEKYVTAHSTPMS